MLSGAAYPHARETCGRWPGPWARTPRRAGALICLFLPLAGQEGRGCRKGWSTSTLATGHGRNFRRPPGPPPQAAVRLQRRPGARAGEHLRVRPTRAGRKWGQREEHRLGVGIRLSPEWPQARPLRSLGLSFFICTMGEGGRAACWAGGARSPGPGRASLLHSHACPAPCQVPPQRAESVRSPFHKGGN